MNTSLQRRLLALPAAALLAATVPASAHAAVAPATSAVDSREAPSIMQREAQAHASLPTQAVPAPITLTPRATSPRAAAGFASPRALTAAGGALNREVFGFAPYWALASGTSLSNGTLSDLQYDKLSTIAYFGLHLDSSGNFVADSGMTGWNSSQMNDLVGSAHAKGVRVVLTAICFNEADINAIVSNPGTGQQAINSIIAAVRQRGLDGVNIDFEGSTSSSYPNIQQGFTGWVHSLSTQLHQQIAGAVLTVDTYSGSASWSGGFMRIDTLAPYVDAFFVMAYDMGLSNTSPGQPGTLPNAPLAGGYTYTDTTSVDQYAQKSGDPNKVILGVPYYGYKFSTTGTGFNAPIQATTGCYSACADPYSTILSEFACASQLQGNWDGTTATPWASWWSPASGDPCGGNRGSYRELYYDNATSLGAKYDLVNNRNIRGSGIWALGYDHGSADLWNAIATKYGNPCRIRNSSITTTPATPEVAAVGLDCELWVHQAGSAGFAPLGGILLAAPALVTSGASSDPYYIATGADHDLYIRTSSTAWQRLNSGGAVVCIDNAAGVAVAGVLWVVCQGADRALWAGHAVVPGSGLPQVPRASWQSLGGILVNGPSAALIGGAPTFFVVGPDHHVYWRTPTSGAYTAIGWLCYGHPATASYAGIAYFACNGADRALWYSTNFGADWAAAASLGGVVVDGPGVAAGPGGPTFYVEGQDTRVWERTPTSGWSSDGGLVQYGVGAAWIP